MKREVIIGILAIATLVIVGCTQVRESTSRPLQGATYQGVLDMLSDAQIVEVNNATGTCDNICSNYYKTCIHAETEYWFGGPNGQWIFHPSPCNSIMGGSRTAFCWCAMPPP